MGGGGGEWRWGARVSDFLLRIQIENKKMGGWKGVGGVGWGGARGSDFFTMNPN